MTTQRESEDEIVNAVTRRALDLLDAAAEEDFDRADRILWEAMATGRIGDVARSLAGAWVQLARAHGDSIEIMIAEYRSRLPEQTDRG